MSDSSEEHKVDVFHDAEEQASAPPPASPASPERPSKLACSRLQILALMLGSLCIFAMGGSIFGISSLYPVLYNHGAYAGVCQHAPQCPPGNGTKCCEEQFARVSLFSSMGFFAADAAAAVWGEVVYKYGAKFTLAAATALSAVAMCMVGFGVLRAELHGMRGSWFLSDVLISIGFIIIGGAGPGIFNGVYVGALTIEEARTPYYEALAATLAAGTFDLSSLVFTLFRSVSHLFSTALAFSCFGWSALSAALGYAMIRCVFDSASEDSGRSSSGSSSSRLDAEAAASEAVAGEESKGEGGAAAEGGDEPSSKGAAAGEGAAAAAEPACLADAACLTTPHNVLLVTFMAMFNLVSSFYLVGHEDAMRMMPVLTPTDSANIATVLNFGFPLLGFATTFLISPLLSYTDEHVPFAVLGTLATTFQLLTMNAFGHVRLSQYAAAYLFGPSYHPLPSPYSHHPLQVRGRLPLRPRPHAAVGLLLPRPRLAPAPLPLGDGLARDRVQRPRDRHHRRRHQPGAHRVRHRRAAGQHAGATVRGGEARAAPRRQRPCLWPPQLPLLPPRALTQARSRGGAEGLMRAGRSIVVRVSMCGARAQACELGREAESRAYGMRGVGRGRRTGGACAVRSRRPRANKLLVYRGVPHDACPWVHNEPSPDPCRAVETSSGAPEV